LPVIRIVPAAASLGSDHPRDRDVAIDLDPTSVLDERYRYRVTDLEPPRS
jgi:hypothetical protein